jgi:hypothetical protein
MSNNPRFDRNERFFGAEGQARIEATRIAIVGTGGLGSFVVAEAAYLGIASFALIDKDVVTPSSLNRLMGSLPEDAEQATPKVLVAERVIRAINPDATVDAVAAWLDDSAAREALSSADVLIGCLDDDFARLQLTEIASRARKPLVDLASEILDGASVYGGRVVFAQPGRRCLWCLDELDRNELMLRGLAPEQRVARDRTYGIAKSSLEERGASVVSINGVVASLAVTELMVYLTGLRAPAITLTYRADSGAVMVRRDEPTTPCPYCGRDEAEPGADSRG